MNEEPKNLDEPIAGGGEQKEYPKVRQAFRRLSLELEPDDLNQKGVQKMILAEVARLENEVARLSEFETAFHEKDKACDVLKSARQKDTMVEILYTVSVAVGCGLIGWLPSSSTLGGSFAVLAMAVALLLFAMFAKWIGGKSES